MHSACSLQADILDGGTSVCPLLLFSFLSYCQKLKFCHSFCQSCKKMSLTEIFLAVFSWRKSKIDVGNSVCVLTFKITCREHEATT